MLQNDPRKFNRSEMVPISVKWNGMVQNVEKNWTIQLHMVHKRFKMKKLKIVNGSAGRDNLPHLMDNF